MGSRLCKGREVEGSQEHVCAENNMQEGVCLYTSLLACPVVGGRKGGRAMRVAKLPPRGAFLQCI